MGFAGTFSETEGQGFLHLWSQDIRRKSPSLAGVFLAELAIACSPSFVLVLTTVCFSKTVDDMLCQQTAAGGFTRKLTAVGPSRAG